MNDIYLCTPGPTPIPGAVKLEMSKPMIHHRSDEFQQIFGQVRNKINELVVNAGETLLLSTSGSGGLEASVGSLLHEGDHVIVVESGKFGQRWTELAKRYRLQADVIEVQWGKAVSVDEIKAKLTKDTKAILTQACETSTGVFHPIAEIGQLAAAFTDCLLVVDAITAIGVHDLNMQRDHIDVLIGGSQKALMCPPGLATVSLSPQALDRLYPSQCMYLSLVKELKTQVKNVSAFTPAVSLVRGLHVALGMIMEEGPANVYARHKMLAAKTRKIFRSARLPLLNRDEDAAHGITVVGPGLGWDVGVWLEDCKQNDGLWLAGGQEHLKGKIFRYAHMGYCSEKSIDHTLALLFSSLQRYIDVPDFERIVGESL